ncbi:MAG: LacI family DNA-binding transcriptional regulator [Candidatus Omnitrophota bacterium]
MMMRISKKNVTIKDIAKCAGVAHSTVSLAMNRRAHVSPRMREKILRIAEEMGYQPNMMARSLICKKSSTVAVIYPEDSRFFEKTYFLMLIEGIQNACKKHNRGLMFFGIDLAKGETCQKISKKWQVNPIIIINADYAKGIFSEIKELNSNGIYFSLITKYFGSEMVNSLFVDNFEGVKLALEYLAGLGHKRVGYISGNLDSFDGFERLNAFKKISANLGLDQSEELITYGDFTFESAEREISKLLRLKRRPTAVFAANDYMALAAIRKIKTSGLSIPKDIAVMGFDDTLEAAYVEPGLTTIKQPLREMGEKAVDLAIRNMEHPALKPQSMIFKPELIKRQSC